MVLAIVVLITASIVAAALLATCALCTGLEPVRQAVADADEKFAEVAPYLGAAGVLLLLKHLTSDLSLRLSRALDWNITDSLYAVEGLFVAHLQTATPDSLYGFFSVMYFFGFPYLLVVPLLFYFLLPSTRRFKELVVAYALNYVVGAICYTLFVAYGPRNWIPEHVDGTMYQLYPETQELTAAVSSRTDVFPSLHTSLSVVVLLFAWHTRRVYPRWFYVSAFTATCVILSTMILGIHWLSDIVAGIALGSWSVLAAQWFVGSVEGTGGRSRTPGDDEAGIASDVGD